MTKVEHEEAQEAEPHRPPIYLLRRHARPKRRIRIRLGQRPGKHAEHGKQRKPGERAFEEHVLRDGQRRCHLQSKCLRGKQKNECYHRIRDPIRTVRVAPVDVSITDDEDQEHGGERHERA